MFARAMLFLVAAVILSGAAADRASGADWQSEWQSVLKDGKKEGEVSLYGGYNPAYRGYVALFEKKYPDIRVDYTPGGGSQLAIRILSERRAGKYLADVVMGGAPTFQVYPAGVLAPMENVLVLPEVTDPAAWWGGHLSFVDAAGKYVVEAMGGVGEDVAYNTKLVDPGAIHAWRDFLAPKWNGKIVRLDMNNSVSNSFIFFYHTPSLGPNFITQFLSQGRVVATQNLRQGVDWLASGKAWIALDMTPQSIDDANGEGLPVAFLPPDLEEGNMIQGGYCCLAVLEGAPHPNATKLFVNWVLSKEGQIAWQNANGGNSLRIDIAKANVPPETIPQKGKSYFDVDGARYNQRDDLDAIQKIVDGATGR